MDSPDTRGHGMFDVVITGGWVVDGTGTPPFRADVAVNGERIAAVGRIDEPGKSRVHADGLVVTPGFIDIHGHLDMSVVSSPGAESHLLQGVTTVMNGNCGHSFAPLVDELDREEARSHSSSQTLFGPIELDWLSFAEYLARIETAQPAINVASLIGHSRIREAVMGMRSGDAAAEELETMRRLVRSALADGAFGMSTGLVSAPGMFAGTAEIAALASELGKADALYASHIRGLGPRFLESCAEAIEIGRQGGCRVQISHASPNFPGWGKAAEFLGMVGDARANGVEVSFDEVTYVRGSSGLARLLPPWAQALERSELVASLRDPEGRRRLRAEVLNENSPDWGSTVLFLRHDRADLIIVDMGEVRTERWISLKELSARQSLPPVDVAFDLLIEDPSIRVQNCAFSEDDYRLLFKSPYVSFESDITAFGEQNIGLDHPRFYGTFPIVFRKYVRGEANPGMPAGDQVEPLLTLEEAVHRMTGVPATSMRLWDRGLVRPGMYADLVVFDPDRIADRATYDDPASSPVGIDCVLVNGAPAVLHSEVTGRRAGAVLRRQGSSAA